MAEKIYKIKPLEWREFSPAVLMSQNTIFGIYSVYIMDGYFESNFASGVETSERLPSLESAKLACQSHYEQRLLASLEEVDVLDRVEKQCKHAMGYAEAMLNDGSLNISIGESRQIEGRALFAQQILTILKEVKE